MTNLPHIFETALLLSVAYLFGCIVGYALRRLSSPRRSAPEPSTLQAPKPQQTVMPATPVARPQSTAARLAMVSPPEEDIAPAGQPALAAAPSPASKITPPVHPVSVSMPAIAPVPEVSRTAKHRPDPKPVGLPAPRAGGKDDLKLIKGIGPKIEQTLNGWGIFHFDQLAKLTKANAAWIDDQLGFRGRVAREAWVAQAKALKAPKKGTK